MREKVVFLGLSFLTFSCSAKVSEWSEAYKYQAPKGWSVEKEGETKLPKPPQGQAEKKESLYEKEVQGKILELLKTTPTPLRVPDTVVRVLVLPHVDEKGNLVSQKYIFFRAEEGKWILGDYLLKKGEPLKELKPLDVEGEKK